MSGRDAVKEITETDPMRREANHGLMVAWINRDLMSRHRCDVRKSIVLYDEDYLFVAASPGDIHSSLWKPLYDEGVRYWSRGIV